LLVQGTSNEHRHRLDGLLSLDNIKSMVKNNSMYYGRDLNITRYEKDKHGVKRRITLDVQPPATAPVDDEDDNGVKVESKVLWKHYKEGCSVRLLCPQKQADKIHALLCLLEHEWGCMVGANTYLTPAGQSQGFAPHYDDIEAFCLQLEGSKRWKVYAPLQKSERLPRTSSQDYTEDDLKDVEPVMDIILLPGDMLYMPRGWIHQAVTVKDEHSLHLTVSAMQQWSWTDLIEILLPEAVEAVATADTTTLRAGLPRGFLEYMGDMHENNEENIPEVLREQKKYVEEEHTAESDYNTQRKEAFRTEAKKRIARVTKEAMGLLDAACDQLGKRFLSDRLPPALTAQEKASTCNGHAEAFNIHPNMLCRLVRPGISRLVLEEGKAVVYHCADNSRVYRELPLSPMEFEMDDAPAIEQLLTTTEPHWICVADLFHESIEDKVSVTQALYDEGVLAVRSD
jgi:lysine-specific demethylase/histidyl-hydroxylase NO66